MQDDVFEEEKCADIVISGLMKDQNGMVRNGAVAIKNGCYIAVGECDEIACYIGLNTVMCGYKNKSVLAGLYSMATGKHVEDVENRFRSVGNYPIVTEGRNEIRIGEPANLVVYDDQLKENAENTIENEKILLKVVNGEIVFRKREKVKKAAYVI